MGSAVAAEKITAVERPFVDTASPSSAKLVILIDDMGHSLSLNIAALNLPGALSFAFLPHTSHSKKLAKIAQASGKDVLLHAPMENIYNLPLGRGAMTSSMSEADFKSTLEKNIAAIPSLIGVNNHMGSKLTALNLQMRWTMEVVKEKGLFFLDSKTTSKSVAWQQAKNAGIAGLKRDIFLDHDLNLTAINRQYQRAIALAKRRGYAVVIAHPHAITIKFLQQRLGQLKAQNVQLVSVSAMINQLKVQHISLGELNKSLNKSRILPVR
ncbi:MAG: hypothetical protein OFPII_31560 [Osedax symbiont Rs1]|nr:MAG: hypothetical protein OFPII_31560 [Osedax symbiont Rs1]